MDTFSRMILANRVCVLSLALLGFLMGCSGESAPKPEGAVEEKAEITAEAAAVDSPESELANEPGDQAAKVDIPATGNVAPEFEAFDLAMKAFMQEYDISSATLAVRADNSLVIERGYGWKDEERTIPTPPDALFRLSSMSKPITSTAIKKLIADGKFDMETKVLDLLPDSVKEGVEIADARWNDITVEMLFNHKGGWGNRLTYTYTDAENLKIAEAFKLDRAPTSRETVRYMLGQPLEFDPGSKESYSGFGYMMLGIIVEEVSGMPIREFVMERIWKPLGLEDLYSGRTAREYALPREVFYYEPGELRDMSDLTSFKTAPISYANVIEDRESWTGFVSTASDYGLFMEHYTVLGEPQAPGTYYYFTGSQPGVKSIAMWEPDSLKIVALFNRSENFREADMEKAMRDAANEVRRKFGFQEFDPHN